MAEFFPFLPGVRVVLKDGGLIFTTSVPVTESVMILGTAVDGPLLVPRQVLRMDDAAALYGDIVDANGVANGATLIRGAQEAFAAGCRNIILVRMTGLFAEGILADNADPTKGILLKAKFPGSLYNDIEITYSSSVIQVNKPVGKGKDFTIDVALDDSYETIAAKINAHTDNNVIDASVIDGSPSGNHDLTVSQILNTASANWAGGDDEIVLDADSTKNKEEFFKRIKWETPSTPGFDILRLLQNTPSDYLVLTDFHVDDITDIYFNDTNSPITVDPGTVQDYVEYGNLTFNWSNIEMTLSNDETEQVKPLFKDVDAADNGNGDPGKYVRVYTTADVTASDWDTKAGWTLRTDAAGNPNDVNYGYAVDYVNGRVRATSSGTQELTNPGAVVNFRVRVTFNYEANFARELADHCFTVSSGNFTLFGVIGSKPLAKVDFVEITKQAEKLLASSHPLIKGFYTPGPDKQLEDIGKFISVLAGPDVVAINERLGNYVSDGAAFYAGFQTTLPPHIAATNKLLPGVSGLRYEFSNKQANDLTGAYYVTFRTRFGGGVQVIDAPTAARDLIPGVQRSDYTRQQTFKIVKAALRECILASQPFLGQGSAGVAFENALKSELKSRLENMRKTGALRDYAFTLSSSLPEQIRGEATLELSLVPAFEFRKLNIKVQLRPIL